MKIFGKKRLNITIVCIVAIIVSPAILVAVWLLGKATQKDIEETATKQFSDQEMVIAEEIAKILETEVRNIQENLNLIAQIPEVKSGDTQACSKKLKEVSESMQVKLGNIGRVNKDGIFYCGVVDSIVGVDGKKYDYLREIISDSEHKPVLSRAIMFQYTDHTRYLAALHIPVFDEGGAFIGTLGGAIYFDELQEKYLQDIPFAKESYVILLDKNGDILSHPTPDFISRNFNDEYMQEIMDGSQEFQDLINEAQAGEAGMKKYDYLGERRLASYRPVQIFNGRYWSVIVTTPTDDIKGFVAPAISKLQSQVFVVIGTLIFFTLGMIILLVRWNQSLAQQVKERTKQVSELNEILRLLNKILRHDISNDLVVMENAVEECLKKVADEGLKNALVAAGRSKKTIDSMRQLETAVSAKEELQPIGVRSVVEEVVKGFPETKFQIENDGTVLADEALASVIENIVRNAIVHGKTDKIDITISQKDKSVEIRIADYGRGIPDEVKKQLFREGFVYGETGHTGLGLYIVRKTIERYGGKVTVEDNKPKGAVFILELSQVY